MNPSSRLIAAALAAVLALTAACAAESKRTESVTTTTDKGTSIAPPAKEAEKRNRALVRFVHAVPDGAAVDAFAGEAKTFPHLAYKTVTSYQELPEGQHTFRVRVSGLDSSPPLAAGGEGLSGGKHYTVITQPSTDTLTPTLRVVNDNLRLPQGRCESIPARAPQQVTGLRPKGGPMIEGRRINHRGGKRGLPEERERAAGGRADPSDARRGAAGPD